MSAKPKPIHRHRAPRDPHNTGTLGFLHLKIVAEQLGVSERTVRRMVADGELGAVRFSKTIIRVPQRALDAWVERRVAEAVGEK